MKTDEEQIRELVQTWISASKAGDIESVLSLMSEDAIFLMPGRPPMTRAEFRSASLAQAKAGSPQFEGHSDIQEIMVLGDWAFMWTKLKVILRLPNEIQPIIKEGPTLSVLKKENGKWVLARDANMLAPVKPSEA